MTGCPASRQLSGSPLPAGLAQSFEHMLVIVGPKPGWALAHKPLKGGGSKRTRPVERSLCLVAFAELAKRCGENAVRRRKLRVSANRQLRRIPGGSVFANEIVAQRHPV